MCPSGAFDEEFGIVMFTALVLRYLVSVEAVRDPQCKVSTTIGRERGEADRGASTEPNSGLSFSSPKKHRNDDASSPSSLTDAFRLLKCKTETSIEPIFHPAERRLLFYTCNRRTSKSVCQARSGASKTHHSLSSKSARGSFGDFK